MSKGALNSITKKISHRIQTNELNSLYPYQVQGKLLYSKDGETSAQSVNGTAFIYILFPQLMSHLRKLN